MSSRFGKKDQGNQECDRLCFQLRNRLSSFVDDPSGRLPLFENANKVFFGVAKTFQIKTSLGACLMVEDSTGPVYKENVIASGISEAIKIGNTTHNWLSSDSDACSGGKVWRTLEHAESFS